MAPPDYHLLVDRNHLSLSIGAPVQNSRPSIDVLFESAAYAGRAGVVAVILSGTSEDGADGVVAVKEKGGVVLVLEPSVASSPVMPRAAIATGAVDHIMTLDEMGRFLRTRFSAASSDPVSAG